MLNAQPLADRPMTRKSEASQQVLIVLMQKTWPGARSDLEIIAGDVVTGRLFASPGRFVFGALGPDGMFVIDVRDEDELRGWFRSIRLGIHGIPLEPRVWLPAELTQVLADDAHTLELELAPTGGHA